MPGRRAPGDTRSFSRVVAAPTAPSLALRGFCFGFLQVRVELERRERSTEQRADACGLHAHPLEVGERFAPNTPRLGMRLFEHHGRLAPCLLPELLRRTFRGHERRPKQRLELAVAHEIRLDPLDLVREVGA